MTDSKTELLLEIVRSETGWGDVSLDSELDSLGIDSLDFVSLLHAVEEAFRGVVFDAADFARIETVRDIRDKL